MNSEIHIVVFPVFMVIGLGYLLKRVGLIQRAFTGYINRLVFYVALPALLFYKISTADFAASFNSLLLLGFSLSVVFIFSLAYGFGFVFKLKPEPFGALVQSAFRGNVTYVGLAVIYNAYGEQGITMAGVLLGFLVPFINFLSVPALLLPQTQREKSPDIRFWVRQVVLNPILLASAAGLLWSYLSLPMPPIIDRTLNILTGMSLPLALLAIGASFSIKKFQGDLGLVGMASILKIIVMPLITGAILLGLGLSGQELAIGVLLACAPTAAAAYTVADQMNSDAELSGTIIMVTTLLSVITYTFALIILQQYLLY